jgi:uncharacterized protein with PQ loop repeat
MRTSFDKNKNNVDDRFELIVNICSVVLPFTTLPQLYTIYIERMTEGVSIITWLSYTLLTIPLLIYSIRRKELPLILLNGFWVLIDAAVVIGLLLY